jgi:hypothetical protein
MRARPSIVTVKLAVRRGPTENRRSAILVV